MTAAAPAQNHVATHCCVCGRELVDATSIEFGIGPVCRRRYNYEDAYPITDLALISETLESNFPGGLDTPDHMLRGKVMDAAVRDDSRRAANVLVYHASANFQRRRGGADVALRCAAVLRVLGYTALAERLAERLIPVALTVADGRISMVAPYSEELVAAQRAVPGRRWDAGARANTFPTTSADQVVEMVRRAVRGWVRVDGRPVAVDALSGAMLGRADAPAPTPAPVAGPIFLCAICGKRHDNEGDRDIHELMCDGELDDDQPTPNEARRLAAAGQVVTATCACARCGGEGVFRFGYRGSRSGSCFQCNGTGRVAVGQPNPPAPARRRRR